MWAPTGPSGREKHEEKITYMSHLTADRSSRAHRLRSGGPMGLAVDRDASFARRFRRSSREFEDTGEDPHPGPAVAAVPVP